ncbi:hypothetical protein CDAR_498661 [Caerostris darwini]|uniref:Uncharacterized protein n=1 Tax=Caerostris darwini TaxID=1538125 RepID=A0AAV4SL08_9ARAC|nr:hypothetical protein CDAR_498661 [Caerostris darwini]
MEASIPAEDFASVKQQHVRPPHPHPLPQYTLLSMFLHDWSTRSFDWRLIFPASLESRSNFEAYSLEEDIMEQCKFNLNESLCALKAKLRKVVHKRIKWRRM